MKQILLPRESFEAVVFARDKHKCVVCGAPAIDAHHILERKLFDDGGYYLNNGVSLCTEHHWEAEKTTLSVEKLRELAGIKTPVIPEHFYPDERYDKWGNIILPTGRRSRGEMFETEQVQKILGLAGLLGEFDETVKYGRTFHAPWSPGCKGDDKMHRTMEHYHGKWVWAGEKKDGENTNMYTDHFHARSIDSRHHESRDWCKALWGRIRYDIPKGWRICGENLYATHSIHYTNLKSFFYVFSIWDENNRRLDLDDQLEWCQILGLEHVPIVYRGLYDEAAIKALPQTLGWNMDEIEGYVLSLVEGFHYSQFRRWLAKYVRAQHVNTDEHWMHGPITPNELIK